MPKPRALSDFLAKELLYDYVTGQLDEPRKDALEKAMKESEEVASDLKSLREGLKYCEALRNTKLSEPYFQHLSQPPKTLRDRAKGWHQIKPGFRYGIEAIIILVIFISIGFMTPKQYRFWESDSGFTVVEWKRDVQAPELAVTEEPQNIPEPILTEVPVKGMVAFGPPTTQLQVVAVPVAAPEPKKQDAKPVEARKGEIIRATLTSQQVEEWTPLVVDKILSLGGIKAGEVQLGWKRKGGSYFHFSLPEANYETLKEYLQTLGPVRIVREPHPRVMPEGTIRLILWIEQRSSGKKTESANGE